MRRPQLDIQLKTPEQIELMRAAGLVVAAALRAMREAVAPGVSTADLDGIAEKVIREADAVPSFKGYHGFPASICASVNEQVVHGIPSPGHVLREGDLLSLDCGAILHGWHGDSAVTVGVGDTDPALQRVRAPLPEMEVSLWLLTHPDLKRVARIRIVLAHLTQQLTAAKGLIEGRAAAART